MIKSTEQLVQLIGIAVFLVEAALIVWLLVRGKKLTHTVKWMSLIALVIGPILLMFLGNYHVFETSKEVSSCGSCHVMKPMVTDMLEQESMTLAARHYKNNWINKNQCYGCHKDYGLNGTMKAKMDGYRHLMRYITKTYEEPIKYRGFFNNNNCGSCHYSQDNFLAIEMHEPLQEKLVSNEISCMNCHGKAHPSRLERTPGSITYDQLISEVENVEIIENAEEIKDYLVSLDKD